MAQPFPLFQGAFGMQRDVARTDVTCWNLVDWIPGLGVALRKRGGWSYASNDISATKGTASYVSAVSYAPFTTGDKLVAIDEDGELYTINTSTNAVTDVGAVVAPIQPPFLHRDKLIIPASDGTTAPKYYDGAATVGSLAGSPPAAKYGCVFKDFSVLGGTAAQPTALYFSDPGDPTSWDTTNSVWKTSYTISGLAAMRNAILIFSTGHCERLRGSIPPPGSDFTLEPAFDNGCIDARSIAPWRDFVIFANTTGVFLTDGVGATDLTNQGGMSTYWRDTLRSYTTSWTVSAGVYSNYYVVSIMNGNTFVDCLVCDLDRRQWFRFANVKATMFAHAVGVAEELFFASRSTPRVLKISSCWNPSATVKNDADGTNVAPVLETPFYRGFQRLYRRWVASQAFQGWKNAFVDYDLRDASADAPTLTLSYIRSAESTSYTTAGTTLAATTKSSRVKRALNFRDRGIAFKVAQTGPSSDTYLYAIEAEYAGDEGSRTS